MATGLLLATGYWLLVTCHWLLATGYWPLAPGLWPSLSTGDWLLPLANGDWLVATATGHTHWLLAMHLTDKDLWPSPKYAYSV